MNLFIELVLMNQFTEMTQNHQSQTHIILLQTCMVNYICFMQY